MEVQLTLADLSSYVVVPDAGGGSGRRHTRRRTRTPEEEQEDFANVVRLALSLPSSVLPPSDRNGDSRNIPPNAAKVEQRGGTRGEDKQGKNSGCQRCLELFLGGNGSVDDVHHRPPDVATVTEKSILRFIKLHDRQCMLASALLKSRSYWEDSIHRLELVDAEESVNDESSGGIGDRGRHRCETCGIRPPPVTLPVVDLPRSDYGKPYLPPRTAARTPRAAAAAAPAVANGDVIVHDLSVSHQYPHVGLARLIIGRRRRKPDHRRSPEVVEPAGLNISGLHVGLDIVVVDEERLSASKSIGEFLSCFEGSFVPSEWGEIMSAGRSGTEVLGNRTLRGMQLSLKEFHVRWAMKEAYSKALGYGLGLDFDSFEIVTPEEVAGGGSSPYTSSSSFSWYLYLRSNDRSSIDESRSPGEEEPFDSNGGTAGGTTDAANDAAGAAAMIPRLVRIRHVRDNVRWSGAESSSSSPSPSSSSCMGSGRQEETWQFWFMFLDDEGGGDGPGDGPTGGVAMSLVCMCVGPVHADDGHESTAFSTSGSAEVATVDVKRESMDGLLRWHH